MGNYRHRRMALEGVTESASALAAGKPVAAAVVDAVAAVEDFRSINRSATAGYQPKMARWNWTPPTWTATRWRLAPWEIWWISPTRYAWRRR